MIAIVIVTHNREQLLRSCIENVVNRASEATTEVLVWDNGSTDGTPAYLETFEDPRFTLVRHNENVGVNAYALAVQQTSAPYLIQLNDDVIDAPQGWDRMLLDAFIRLPDIGFLGTDLVDDPDDENSYLRHHMRPHAYTRFERNGVELLDGPAGSWCAMTSRELYDRAGGFRQKANTVYWSEDAAYIEDIGRLGFRAAILPALRVHHAGGPRYTPNSDAKRAFATRHLRAVSRKNALKRCLLALPLVGRLNARYGWFAPPEEWWKGYFERFDLYRR